jgi:hypothetical protein
MERSSSVLGYSEGDAGARVRPVHGLAPGVERHELEVARLRSVFIELFCFHHTDSRELCPSVHCFPLAPWRIIGLTLVL